ncbi:MAG: hypothetical protein LRY32_04335 [Flavobacterium sp.]|nr:hypothetical protein [Flavobacterium sp.]
MKKTNRFWVMLPAVAMLFTSALQASESTTTNTTPVAVVKITPSQLNVAISKGDLAKVQQLVEIGVDVNKKRRTWQNTFNVRHPIQTNRNRLLLN